MKDTDLDDVLTQQGQAWRNEQPTDPALPTPAAVDTHTSRQWKAPLLAAAAVVIGAVVTTIVVRGDHSSGAENSSAATSTTVGWAARPAGPSRSPSFYSGLSPSTPTAAAKLPSCDSDFDTRFILDDQGGTVVLSHRGSADCAMPDATPIAQLLDSDGAVLATGGESLAIGRFGVRPIAVRQVVLVPVQACDPSAVSLRLRFQDGEVTNTPLPPGLACTGGSQTGVGVTHQRTAAGASLGSLIQTISAPSSVPADHILYFRVTLTNGSDFAVPLSPCPSFDVALEDVLVQHDAHAARSSGQLNCTAGPDSVAAHASISYDLQLDVSGVPTGPRRLVWTWLGDWPADGFAGYPTVTVQ